ELDQLVGAWTRPIAVRAESVPPRCWVSVSQVPGGSLAALRYGVRVSTRRTFSLHLSSLQHWVRSAKRWAMQSNKRSQADAGCHAFAARREHVRPLNLDGPRTHGTRRICHRRRRAVAVT